MGDFQDVCPQCGFTHPPIALGQKCPLVKDKTSSGEIIDSSQFLIQMKNVVVSKIQVNKIKNSKKVFSAIIVEVTKFLDQYKEG